MIKSAFSRLLSSTAWKATLLMGVGVMLTWMVAVISSPFGVQEAQAAKHKSLPPYTVSQTGTGTANQTHSASASCDEGDQATGGGFEGVDFSTTRIMDSSPFASINSNAQVDTWTVDYVNGTNADPVRAIVVCRDRSPKHS